MSRYEQECSHNLTSDFESESKLKPLQVLTDRRQAGSKCNGARQFLVGGRSGFATKPATVSWRLQAAAPLDSGLWWVLLIAGLGISVCGRTRPWKKPWNSAMPASFVLFCQNDEDEKRVMCRLCMRPFVYPRVSHHHQTL